MKDIKNIIASMSLEEKASLMSGKNFWNTRDLPDFEIPSIMLTDGPHGLRKQGGKADHLGLHLSKPATCFPTAATLANSWDETLLEEVGRNLGLEARQEEVRVLLGPGLNIKRNPLCGRNFEYYSEDPYLSGKMAAANIRGIQSTGTAACPKHFAVNSQEHLRMTVDEIVDERALRELYLEGFRIAVKEGRPETIMTAYNRVNGEYANENKKLLKEILYGEWNFKGVTVTDWGGNNDRVEGLKAGNQLEMPYSGGVTNREIVEAVRSGELDEALLDQRVNELLRLVLKPLEPVEKIDFDDAHRMAIKAAEQSIVLLKNEEKHLPLDRKKTLALIGDFAFVPRYQGAGSSLINPSRLDVFSQLIADSDYRVTGQSRGYKRFGGKSFTLKKEALKAAQKADRVLLFLGLDEGSEAEGVDRAHMRLPQNQLDLVEALLKVNDNIIVILSGGSPVEMPFADKVKAIIYSCLSGQGGATALMNVLSGEVNPSGKLAETFPTRYDDVPSCKYYPGLENSSEHRESIFIGYRYYSTVNVPVLYPFGHGLSYTDFKYSDLQINNDKEISLRVKNSGERAGQEIIQLYISAEKPLSFRAKQELKGFRKITLAPGEEKEITFSLKKRDFAYYNKRIGDWSIESGSYEIKIGASSEDIRLSRSISISGDDAKNPYDRSTEAPYYEGRIQALTSQDFRSLLDIDPSPLMWDRKRKLGLNDTFAQCRHKPGLGAMIYWFIRGVKALLFLIGKPLAGNNVMFVMNMPFRQIERFSQGKISKKAVINFLKIINLSIRRGTHEE